MSFYYIRLLKFELWIFYYDIYLRSLWPQPSNNKIFLIEDSWEYVNSCDLLETYTLCPVSAWPLGIQAPRQNIHTCHSCSNRIASNGHWSLGVAAISPESLAVPPIRTQASRAMYRPNCMCWRLCLPNLLDLGMWLHRPISGMKKMVVGLWSQMTARSFDLNFALLWIFGKTSKSHS